MRRRQLLTSAVAAATLLARPTAAASEFDLCGIGGSQPFDYARLKRMARALAARTYRAPSQAIPAALKKLSWDAYQAIGFRHRRALWHDLGLDFRIELFHLGHNFTTPVRMHEVVDGRAHEIAYDPQLFDYGRSGVDGSGLPADLGFAGWRLFFGGDWQRDIAAFLGASYFRAVGGSKQYGLSARGLAIDTGLPGPEEFPVFTAFWFQRPTAGDRTLEVYALMDSPSVAGAYRFAITPGAELLMLVDTALYPRATIERLGIAPATSMFWCGENEKLACDDVRPEIHDSDGLSMWTGAGEWIWRPLHDPQALRVNSYLDRNPKGFGLLQRDQDFDRYQDDGAWYNRRPGLWIEPVGDWGCGAVQLVELPTEDETNDNVVAYWNPDKNAAAGQEWLLTYRLYWGGNPPAQSPLARVVATRTGMGGVVGAKRTHFSRRFEIDFAGAGIDRLAAGAGVEPVITASRGRVELPSARPLLDAPDHAIGYRAIFDLAPTDASTEPINLRLYLRREGKPLTETWLYQWIPPPPDRRRT
ncbi:MAG: glucan biosynthesis protein D [Gammaproteobacteria bacterium]|nr:glucan biosynthesis protein D [Gammaproteobacteria bacterium]